MKKLENLLKYKYLIFFFILVLAFIRSNFNNESIYSINDNVYTGVVTEYKVKDDYVTFTLKGKEKIKCNYYFKDNKKIDIKYGDKLVLGGELKQPTNNTIPNNFNYKKYLLNNNIYYILTVKDVYSIKQNNNIFYKIKNWINNRINKIDNKGYLNAFILGNKSDIDSEVYETYKKNGIMHIFSVSGMHISILASIILFVLNTIKKSENNIVFVILFLIFYMIFTNYQASIVRSVVFYILLKTFKMLKININTKDTLLTAISLIILINPRFIYNIGFLYSSIISFTLIIYSDKFNKKYFINILLISIVSFLISLPITVNNNYVVNLLGIFINIIFVPLISFLLYPLALIVFIFPFLYKVFLISVNIIESVSLFFNRIELFNISIPRMNILVIFIYYILVYLVLSKNKKFLSLLIIFIMFIKYINLIDPNCYAYFIDIGQGDMSVIKYKDETIVIDTGPKKYNSNYEIMDNVITFFRSIGINDIDLMVISHGDGDHIGNVKYLMDNFRVRNVMINKGEINELESNLDRNKIINNYKSKLNFYTLEHDLKDDENSNSIINYLEVFNNKLLFMGDAPKDVELEILDKYKIKSNFIKLGHHGSNTSSDYNFLKSINAKYAIISSGKNNIYNHPSEETLYTLNKLGIKYYNTQDDGTIVIKMNKSGCIFKTYMP